MSKAEQRGLMLEEKLLFELSEKGARGPNLPNGGFPEIDASTVLGKKYRSEKADLPELSETRVARHYTRLSSWNYSVDHGIYPLGSCTMKYNPRINESLAADPAYTSNHPYFCGTMNQGVMTIIHELQEDLKEILGMPGISLQPAAGAHGEWTALLMFAKYFEKKGQKRTTVLVPDTAHGTNPASAAMAGYKVKSLPTDIDGTFHPEVLKEAICDDTAGLMITNPNTLGIFETHIKEIADILHENDSLLYIDGANMNAIMGIVRPGDFGADVIHLNLHKTFSTPHGGGGPGSGPIGVSSRLIDYLPTPAVVKENDSFKFDYSNPNSVGPVKAYFGNMGVLIRAWAYIKTMGGKGLHAASNTAIANAAYLKHEIGKLMNIPIKGHTMHEVVFNDEGLKEKGWDTLTIAKHLIDYGIHPPTVYFPLLVSGAFMVEPTETEDLEELNRLVDAIKEILESEPKEPSESPSKMFRKRVDETKAARELRLVYTKED